MVNVGQKAPPFTLVDTELKMRSLDEFKGKKVVLSFFVAASSPVCTKEMCTFRDEWNQISKLGAQVIGISNDGPFANKAFAEAQHLNFPVLGDYKSQTIRDYDVLMADLLHVKGYDAAKRFCIHCRCKWNHSLQMGFRQSVDRTKLSRNHRFSKKRKLNSF